MSNRARAEIQVRASTLEQADADAYAAFRRFFGYQRFAMSAAKAEAETVEISSTGHVASIETAWLVDYVAEVSE